MKRYIPFLCFVFVLTSLPTLSAGNRGCAIKKLATRPLPQRIGSRLGYQPTAVGIRLSGEIAVLTEQLEEMNLAMQEKDLLQAKYVKEIEQLKQSLAAEQNANKKLVAANATAQKATAAEAKAKQAALDVQARLATRWMATKAAIEKAAAEAKASAEKNANTMSEKIAALQTELTTFNQATQNSQKQLQQSQQQLEASQDQVKALKADIANIKQAEQQRQKDEEKKRSQQKAVESAEGKDETEVTDDNPAPKDPDSPTEKADDQAAIKEPETDAEGSAK